MRKLVISAACLAAFLFAFSAGAVAQTTALEGDVIGEDGQPLSGALILIERTDIQGQYKVKTKKRGHYFHAGLPLGTYEVKCVVDGKVVDQMAGVRLTLGASNTVNFDLAAVARKQAALEQAAATGQLTEEQTKGLTAEQKATLKKQMEARSKTAKKNKDLNDSFNAAMSAKELKQWDVAIENFKKAAELDPEQAVIWAQLADAAIQGSKMKTGDAKTTMFEEGVAAYVKVIEMQPEDPAYHNNYGLALAQAGRMEEAEIELNKAAELNPAGAGQYFYNLGAVLINVGKTEEATGAFKKAIEIDSNYANAYFQYGMQLLNQATLADDGSMVVVDGTKEALEKYLELAPDGPFAPSAQGALGALVATISTEYVNPDSPRKTKKK